MSVKYYSTQVPFVRAELPYSAHVTEEQSLSDQDIEDRMVESGSGFTRSNIKGVRELQRRVVLDAVREGKGIHTRLFIGGFSIGGGLPDADALYNPERNTLLYNVWAGPDVVAAAKEAHTQKVGGPTAGPLVLHVHDQTSLSTDDRITPGGNVRVTGKRLKIVGTDPSVGIFLRRLDGMIFNVDLRELIVNKPGELIFRLPGMYLGQFYMLLVTQYSGAKLLKTPHTTMFDKVLTAAYDESAPAVEAEASAEKKGARKRGTKGGATAG